MRGLHTASLRGIEADGTAGNENEKASSTHTEANEQEVDGEQQLRDDILQASLPFVHTLGWSQDAIAEGKC